MKYDADADRFAGCRHLVDQVTRRVAPNQEASGEELTELAGRALERYAEGLLEALLADAERVTEPMDAWIKRQFAEGLDRAGAALREALAESRHRHAVAQGLQRKMFEAETMLRRAIKSKYPDAAASVIAAS